MSCDAQRIETFAQQHVVLEEFFRAWTLATSLAGTRGREDDRRNAVPEPGVAAAASRKTTLSVDGPTSESPMRARRDSTLGMDWAVEQDEGGETPLNIAVCTNSRCTQ